MIKNLQTKIVVLFTAILTLAFTNSQASHIVGGFISYQHLTGLDYKVNFKFYRDCSGITPVTSASVCVHSSSLAYDNSILLNLDTVLIIPANNCAPTGLTTCQGGTFWGMEEYSYSAIITLPAVASDWIFEYTDCCRNSAITTLTNGGGEGYYTYTTLDNLTSGANSTPTFNNTIFNEYCAGVYTVADYSCSDVDGDSLVYRLDTCFSNSCNQPHISVIYQAPYNYLNFISSFTPITLNNSSGLLTFTPSQIQIGVVSIIVDEYRNGVKISSMKRDDEIVIVQGIANPDNIYGKVYYDSNNNQTYDAGEPGIAGEIIEVQPGNLFGSTGPDGGFTVGVIPGTYSVSYPNPPLYATASPASYSLTFVSLGGVDSTSNFGVNFQNGNITDCQVSVTHLTSARPGFNCIYQVDVTNVGTAIAGGNLDFTFDPQFTFVQSTPSISSQTGSTLTYNIGAILPQQTATFNITLYLDSNAVVGDSVNFNATMTTANVDTTPIDNVDAMMQVITNSLDPNLKEVWPNGPVPTTYVQQGNWLEYTIHFQNTGTAPAINIILNDPLDWNLQIGTFEKIASSHPCTFNIAQQGLLTVNFNNINLADWISDEPNSHGFFKFRVKPKTNLQPGNQIMNTANIFFDNNLPLATNTVTTLVMDITAINSLEVGNLNAALYPNPASNNVIVKVENKNLVSIDLFDISGRLMIKKEFYSQTSFDINKWSEGIYIYRIQSKDGSYTMGKLIKQ